MQGQTQTQLMHIEKLEIEAAAQRCFDEISGFRQSGGRLGGKPEERLLGRWNEQPDGQLDERLLEQRNERPDGRLLERRNERWNERWNEQPDKHLLEQQDERLLERPDERLLDSPDVILAEEALAARDAWKKRLQPRALFRQFGSDVIGPGGLLIDSRFFPCQVLDRLDKKHVLAVYAFVLTVGDTPDAAQNEATDNGLAMTQDGYTAESSLSLTESVLADFWGTAYVKAATEALRTRLCSDHAPPSFLSAALAPGFYDMGLEKLSDLLQILDSRTIGVSAEGAMMKPLKSVAGFYIAVDDEAQLSFFDPQCLHCYGRQKDGCTYCRFG